MKTPEQERLLNDVLHGESYTGFRTEVCETMLAELRRQRRARRMRQMLALAACILLALALHWLVQLPDRVPPSYAGVPIVRSVPLRPDQLVTTVGHGQPFAVIQSRDIQLAAVQMEIVRTVAELPANTLTDEQLLDLFKGRPVALVSLDTGKRLLLLDEDLESDVGNP